MKAKLVEIVSALAATFCLWAAPGANAWPDRTIDSLPEPAVEGTIDKSFDDSPSANPCLLAIPPCI